MKSKEKREDAPHKIGIKGWGALIILVVLFSGIFSGSGTFLKAFDLSNLVGSFGQIAGGLNFQGQGGVGAREGFLFALTLIPTTCVSVGFVRVCEGLGGMVAARKLFTPLLKPLLGIPGTSGIAFVASFTSSDVASFMTRKAVEEGHLTDSERTVFVAYQYAASAVIINTISTQAPLLPLISFAVGPIILFLWVFKVLGANIMRLIVRHDLRVKEAA